VDPATDAATDATAVAAGLRRPGRGWTGRGWTGSAASPTVGVTPPR